METRHHVTPLGPVLALTFVCSLGTGVFWHGMPFIAKHTYDFAEVRNLLLSAAMGLVYTIGAFSAGAITRWVERRLTPRGVLASSITVLSLSCLAPVLTRGEWALWLAALLGTWVTSLMWPLIESYVSAGRHGAEMRSAIGWFNLTWAPAVAVPMFAMAPILEHHGQWAIGATASIGVVGLVLLRGFEPFPGTHDPEVATAHVGDEYPLLVRSAQVLLPLSYVLNSAMNPILPYRFEDLGMSVQWETPAAATWIVVRVGAFLLLWRYAFWHGRWGTLLLGAIAMTGGFGLVVGGGAMPIVLVGLGVLGAGFGIVYYAALYYAMAVGRAQVEASGRHEGLIGAGYAAGPLLGLTGLSVAARTGIAPAVGIIGMVWALVGVGSVAAVRPYLIARRQRAARRESG